jgi:hypothetical protein
LNHIDEGFSTCFKTDLLIFFEGYFQVFFLVSSLRGWWEVEAVPNDSFSASFKDRLLRFTGKKMNSTPTYFFTADEHYGHTNIIKFCNRSFTSVDEMDTEIIQRHNEMVGSKDVVIHAGDFSLSKNLLPKITFGSLTEPIFF